MSPLPNRRDAMLDQSIGPPHFAVVGNPANRRVTGFTDAVHAAGLPAPRVLPWIEVLRCGAVFRPGELVRIDSPGEDPEVDRLLRGSTDLTRVEGGVRWYRGFTRAVVELAAAAEAGGARLLNDPDELAVLFDKRWCHGVLSAAGVPVPSSPTSGPAAPPVGGWADLKALLKAAGLHRAFIKPAHGSSASGVIALATAGPGRVRAVSSAEYTADGKLYNSLRVRRYETEVEVGALVDALAPEGLHVERWLPKAGQGNRTADLRVVVVNGRATHAVLRTSRHPMTNLHLGGTRGDLATAQASIEAAGASWAGALDICERAAACFPRSLCVGVDLLPAVGWRNFAVGEVNAFGDLLPGLTGLANSGAEHLDTYGAQVAAVLADPGTHPPRNQ